MHNGKESARQLSRHSRNSRALSLSQGAGISLFQSSVMLMGGEPDGKKQEIPCPKRRKPRRPLSGPVMQNSLLQHTQAGDWGFWCVVCCCGC
jgi:hypothetical protein